MRPARRALLLSLLAIAALDLVAWRAHVIWRGREEVKLAPVVEQIETLRAQIAEDDAWIARNERISQGYAQHERYARRLVERGRRARGHDVMVQQYNERIRDIYRRWYLAPVPMPEVPVMGEVGG